MKSFFKKYLTGLFSNSHQKGAALIVTLIVMLVLVLLGLSLIVQSNTEHLIAKNEQDAFQALANGEAALELSNQIIREWVKNQTPIPTNLTPVLSGDVDGGGTDEILGFRSFNAGLSRSQLNDANEETTSALYNDGAHNWEVFRIGVDTDSNGQFDPDTPRTLIFARVEDNYDTAQDMTDTDLRIRMVIDAEYPVFLNEDGTENTSNISVRPRAKRRLYGRFWPGGHYAIRTDGDLALWGGDAANPLQLCGECGSAHANGTVRAGKVGEEQINVCGEITGTGNFEYNGGTIVGDRGLAPEVFIPVINPYYPIYVPDQSYFAQTVTLRDAAPGPQYNLSCPAPSATDPGSSKYFALVRNTTGPNRMAQVWKAYPDFTDTKKWYWRLIDEKWAPGNPPGGALIGEDLDAKLDNCGRVVECNATIGCSADRISLDNGATWNSLPPGSAVADAGNSEFYGWAPAGNYGTLTCTGDNISSSGIGALPDLNDNYKNDFNYVTTTSPLIPPTTAVSLRSCGVGVTCPAVPPLPGTGVAEASPGNSDFKTATVLNDAGWGMSGGNIYSPMYGAVLFVYGDVDLSGNLSDIVFNDGACGATGCSAGAQQDISNAEAVPTNTWKVTVISYGHADVGGGVRYSPAFGTNANYQYAVVAGRDLRLHGSNNNFDCNGADCDGTPSGTAADYSGIFVLHGQLDFSGNVGVNGFVIAEDRIDCDNFVSPTGGNLANEAHGSLQIHYDCVNPADPWASRGVKLREWEEVQR